MPENLNISMQDISNRMYTQNSSGTVIGKTNERNKIEETHRVETNTKGSPSSKLDAPGHTPLSPTEKELGRILGKNIENIA